MQDAAVAAAEDLLPLVPYLARDAAGEPALIGGKCGACGEIFLGSPAVCARCGARASMTPVRLAHTGRLFNWTTVHRSLPGVATPFVFAIVDLDGGGVVKGNLLAAQPEIRFDMPVRVTFAKADKRDAKGRSYLSYYFVKA